MNIVVEVFDMLGLRVATLYEGCVTREAPMTINYNSGLSVNQTLFIVVRTATGRKVMAMKQFR
jgi:hypothetical protein